MPGLVPLARNIVLPTASGDFHFPLAGASPGTYPFITAVTASRTLSLAAPLATTVLTIRP